MIDFDKMKALARPYAIDLSENQLFQLDQYAKLLVEWNEKMNLTAITDPEGIMIRHFEDSFAVLKYVNIPPHSSLIDVGTGAGFPGMVLKIVRSDLKITLLDSLQKRIYFLDCVSQHLGLTVSTIHCRAEEGGKDSAFREKFDFACARAVANMRELVEYCIPYVRTGGQFFSMKGPKMMEELDSARPGIGTLGGKVSQIHEYAISDQSERTLIVIDKMKLTPPQFPRPFAKIKKKPL